MKLKVHPAISHANAILKSIPEKTGKTVEEWAQLLADAGVTTSKAMAAYLRDHHDIARPTATVLFAKINDIRADFEDAVYLEHAPAKIDKQYTGGKARLRKVADAVFAQIDALGADVGASPTKSMVSFYRHHVFAQVQAATQNRIDVGLALGGYTGAIPGRINDTGGGLKGDRITHTVAVTRMEDIDGELIRWMKTAYKLDT